MKDRLILDNHGKFKSTQKKVLKNTDGFYKIRIKEWESWRDLTHDDTAMAIAGKGNPETRIFTSEVDLKQFIRDYWESEPATFNRKSVPVINQDWEVCE